MILTYRIKNLCKTIFDLENYIIINKKKKKTMQSQKCIKCNSNQRKYIGTPNHIYGMVERATKYIN